MSQLLDQSPKYEKEKKFVEVELPKLKQQTQENIEKLKKQLTDLEEKVGLETIRDRTKPKITDIFKTNKTTVEEEIVQIEKQLHLEEKRLASQQNINIKELVDLSGVGNEARSNLKEFYKSVEKAEKEAERAQEKYQQAIKEYHSLIETSEWYIRIIKGFEDEIMKEGFVPAYAGHKWRSESQSPLGHLPSYHSRSDLKTKHNEIKI